ncbi:hypothetical protein [Methanopyrus sp. SNP6]|uniref:hypothetical protein n=1 Tax=Methanopyrus sp. SNP6 TaxID=1937005 RepID=UPI0011E5DD58|nr:hypothetical protein [Methanopyrus sp. SNP6]
MDGCEPRDRAVERLLDMEGRYSPMSGTSSVGMIVGISFIRLLRVGPSESRGRSVGVLDVPEG